MSAISAPFSVRESGRLLLLAMLCAFWFALFGCSRVTPPPATPPGHPKPYRVGKTWYQPVPHAKDFKQSGIASWYGRKFHGRKTSSGEIYDMHAMTAAHKTLPLGTFVRVQNLANRREVVVKVNDRGPFVRGRIIDLSFAAAKDIGLVGPGTAPVQIVALGAAAGSGETDGKEPAYRPVDYYSGNFTIQIGAFKDPRNAQRLKDKLSGRYKNAHITEFFDGRDTFFRVRVGQTDDLNRAVEYETLLIQDGYKDAFIIAE